MTNFLDWVATARKAAVAAVGVAVTLLTAYNHIPFLPDQPLVSTLLGVLTVVATWLVPNKPAA